MSNILNLVEVKDLPSIGNNSGAYVDVQKTSGRDSEGNDYSNLEIRVRLDSTDSSGKFFEVTKKYSLLPRSRGLSAFRKDYRSWSGKKLSDRELASFDPDKLMTGQRVVAVVKHKKEGSEVVPAIDTFLPPTVAGQASA